jgi:hypothetical protein
MDDGRTPVDGRAATRGWQVVARCCFGATALAVAAGMGLNVVVTATNPDVLFPTVPGRLVNLFCYFTNQSNLIVGAACLLLALRLHRTSTVFRVVRLTGLVGITITGVVYHIALAQLRELTGHAAVADFMLHMLVPILCVVGWLAFGPRGLTSTRVLLLTLLYPAAWLVFTLIRGAAIGYYLYPFLDVGELGYGLVARNVAVITLLFLAVAAVATALDRRLPRVTAS